MGFCAPTGRRAQESRVFGVDDIGPPVIGTEEFVNSALQETIDKASEYVAVAYRILCPDGAPHHTEEYLQLMRHTLPGRFQHHCAAVTHPCVDDACRAFDNLQITAYSQVVGTLDSPHYRDTRDIVHNAEAWGGRGYTSMFDHRASYLLAAWKMSWAHMRRRIGTLRRMPVYLYAGRPRTRRPLDGR